jgi:type I restriction enzyme S subunit
MSFPQYPEYKDSGVEWLGEVPVHWNVGSARWLTQRYSGGTPDKTKLEYWEDGTVPWLNSGAVNDRLITEPSTYITDEAFSKSSAKWIPKGALVMALAGQGKTKGMVAQLGISSTCNQSMAAIIPGAAIEGRFLFWWLDGNYQNIRNMAGGDLRDGLNLELLGNIQCPLPSHDEQTQIAAFLDRETAKIDELVAEQRRLMELLKEKRQAVISHAVTRGLNPHAPMKPSGIEWLGDVPEHWEVGPLKRFWSVTDCKHVTAEFVDDGIPLASIREVQSRWVTLEGAKCTTEHFYELLIEGGRQPLPGDLIFSRNATVGEVAQVHADHQRFAMGQDVVLLRKGSTSYSSDYLQHVIRSPIIVLQLANMMIGSTFKRINVEEIRSFLMPSPPPAEQVEIATFLEAEVRKSDTLTTEAQRAIDLLQERRTALISAAVTGQIDVRSTELAQTLI